MEEASNDRDRDIRKEIAAAGGSGEQPTIFTRAFQYFVVPLLILGACVGLYVLVNVLVADPRDPRALIKELKEGGPHARKYAAIQLTQLLRQQQDNPDQTLTPDLLAVYNGLRADEIELRVYLIRCLGMLRDNRATDTLLATLKNDPDLAVKSACMDALGAIKDPQSAPDLLKLLDHREALVRKYAAFNLGAVAGADGDTSVLGPMRRLLEDPVEDVRWNTAFSLAFFMKDASGIEVLRKMLDRPYLEKVVGADPERDALIRHAMTHACTAIGHLRDKSFLEALKKIGVSDPDQEVRRVAQEAARELER